MIQSTLPGWDPLDLETADPQVHAAGYKFQEDQEKFPFVYPLEDLPALKEMGLNPLRFGNRLYVADPESDYPRIGLKKLLIRSSDLLTGRSIITVPWCYKENPPASLTIHQYRTLEENVDNDWTEEDSAK